MKIYITTDTHFGHDAIIEYCSRPKNHEELIENGYKLLTNKHVLVHCGDVCWGNDTYVHERYFKYLPCKKILVKGNHDSKSDNWYLSHGWDFVCDSFSIIRHKKTILFTHKPRTWDGIFDINIHGHLHNSQHRTDELKTIQKHGQYLVCIEDLKYQLKPLDEILGELSHIPPNE